MPAFRLMVERTITSVQTLEVEIVAPTAADARALVEKALVRWEDDPVALADKYDSEWTDPDTVGNDTIEIASCTEIE